MTTYAKPKKEVKVYPAIGDRVIRKTGRVNIGIVTAISYEAGKVRVRWENSYQRINGNNITNDWISADSVTVATPELVGKRRNKAAIANCEYWIAEFQHQLDMAEVWKFCGEGRGRTKEEHIKYYQAKKAEYEGKLAELDGKGN